MYHPLNWPGHLQEKTRNSKKPEFENDRKKIGWGYHIKCRIIFIHSWMRIMAKRCIYSPSAKHYGCLWIYLNICAFILLCTLKSLMVIQNRMHIHLLNNTIVISLNCHYWKLYCRKSTSQSLSEPFNLLMSIKIERLAAQLCLRVCNDFKSRTQTLFACPINLWGIWSCANRAVCIKIHSLKIASELNAAHSLWTLSTWFCLYFTFQKGLFFFFEKETIVFRGINWRLKNVHILMLWIPKLVCIDCKVARFKSMVYIAPTSVEVHVILKQCFLTNFRITTTCSKLSYPSHFQHKNCLK